MQTIAQLQTLFFIFSYSFHLYKLYFCFVVMKGLMRYVPVAIERISN